jgi:hypothetical protein
MKYAVEMGSGAMIYMPSFVKTDSAIQKLMRGIHRQHGDRISLLSFFKNQKNGLNIKCLKKLFVYSQPSRAISL